MYWDPASTLLDDSCAVEGDVTTGVEARVVLEDIMGS